jgi:hypothetical protein
MDSSQPIDEHSIQAGVEAFVQSMSDLSKRHYGRSAPELLEGVTDDDLSRKQHARLLGVMVKAVHCRSEAQEIKKDTFGNCLAMAR